jgi:hypothetical protein
MICGCILHADEIDKATPPPLPILQPPKHTLTINFVRSAFSEESFLLYKKYDRSPAISSLLICSYRYQIAIHKDAPSKPKRDSYARFLCETPLQFGPPTAEQRALGFPGYGSFHQEYFVTSRAFR